MQALLIPLGEDWYALELAAVREVLPLPDVTPVPGAPAAVHGLFNLRGTVLPLLDTASLLGLAPGGPPAFAVVADTGAGPAALTATAMPAGATLGDPAGPAELPAAVARFATEQGGVATLVDLEALLEGLGA